MVPSFRKPHLAAVEPTGLERLSQAESASRCVAAARDLDELLRASLQALDEHLGYAQSMILVPGVTGDSLVVLVTRGYPTGGVGAEVPLGSGAIGQAAAARRVTRAPVSAITPGVPTRRTDTKAAVPLPTLHASNHHLALPLQVQTRLLGVLVLELAEDSDAECFDAMLLQMLGHQIAMGMEWFANDEPESVDASKSAGLSAAQSAEPVPATLPTRRFVYYANDDCIFVDGEYLIRNVPGRILWKLLGEHQNEGRREFTNRELRLDPSLGLPPVKDNLESRLILLRKRLALKCPELRLVPIRRGRFALQVAANVELQTRHSERN